MNLHKMESGSYNIISFLAEYGHMLNRISSLAHEYIYPQCCNISENNNITRIESKCDTTATVMTLLLTGQEYDNWRLIQDNDLDDIMDKLFEWNFIQLSISCNDNFLGHILLIIRDDDLFYIIQSYLFQYNITIHVADEDRIRLFIANYLQVFNHSQWTKRDIALWKCLTGVDSVSYNNKSRLYVSWWYSYPNPFTLNSKNFQVSIKKLLNKAYDNIDENDFEYLSEVMGYYEKETEEEYREWVKSYIEELMLEVDRLDHNINLPKLTINGCL